MGTQIYGMNLRVSNGNGSNDIWEAWGLYSNNPVYLNTNCTNLVVTLVR